MNRLDVSSQKKKHAMHDTTIKERRKLKLQVVANKELLSRLALVQMKLQN
jgi:hypothetical protein